MIALLKPGAAAVPLLHGPPIHPEPTHPEPTHPQPTHPQPTVHQPTAPHGTGSLLTPAHLTIGFIILVIAIFLFRVLKRLGRRTSNDEAQDFRVVRGSSVEDVPEKQAVRSAREGSQAITLGTIGIPSLVEAQHFAFIGTTGTGKSQGIRKILATIRTRGKRAMVADAGGESLSLFYRKGDLLFNPFDQRSVDWSPFAEVRNEYDCATIAKAAIPDTIGDANEWHLYAQTLLAEVMMGLFKLNQRSMKELMYYLFTAGREELLSFLEETPAAMLCREGNEKMLAGTRGVISTFLTSWKYLKDRGKFSIREWVQNDGASSWLFIVYRDDQFNTLRSLVSTLMELGIVEGLSLSIAPDRDLWFIMDEVDSLGKVNSLSKALSRFRKYGCKCVLGLQTISQLRVTYGRDESQSLMANISTKVVLRPGDGETAEYLSQELGEQEIEREQRTSGTSRSLGRQRTATNSTSTVRETRRTVLGGQLTKLKDLHGYIKYPGFLGKIELEYSQYREVTSPFIKMDS